MVARLIVIPSKRSLRGAGSGRAARKRRVLCDAVIARLARFHIKTEPLPEFLPPGVLRATADQDGYPKEMYLFLRSLGNASRPSGVTSVLLRQ